MVRYVISIMYIIYIRNAMFYHLLESSYRHDSNKSSNIGLGEKVTQIRNLCGASDVILTFLVSTHQIFSSTFLRKLCQISAGGVT